MIRKIFFLFSKKHEKIWHALLIVVTCVGMLGSLFLCFQSYTLKKASLELLDLKEDYRVYTNALKKILTDQAYEGEHNTQSDQKKKERVEKIKWINPDAVVSSDSLEDHFFVINRDPDYLDDQSLRYARQHGLYDEVYKMIYVQELEKAVMPQRKQSKKIIKKRLKKGCAEFVGIPAGKGILNIDKKKGVYDFDFSWPIDRKNFWLSSLFGPRRLRNRGWKFHYGIDMAAHKGTLVTAAATGIVLESYWNNGYGNCIIVAHNKKYKTRYAHLDKRLVKVGQKVKRGQVIGKVGDTGLVRKSGQDASHLHFEVYAFGKHVNPLSVLV
ncbi:M23 family metallopeptidase [Candidatus Babeliales bacterium]|nr:M23 family metallopeptidase [Candidatus Babeliales bacterium]